MSSERTPLGDAPRPDDPDDASMSPPRDGGVLEDRAICSRWAREHVAQLLNEQNAPVNWFFCRDCQRWRG